MCVHVQNQLIAEAIVERSDPATLSFFYLGDSIDPIQKQHEPMPLLPCPIVQIDIFSVLVL